MKYRPDIDGLRALAIIPVLLFHSGFLLFSGGYVGVDVFFVISGFLITRIMFSEISEKKFSIVSFYERRIRRIFPALFVMVLVVYAVSAFLLIPTDFIDFSESVGAAALSVSNIFFWIKSGYFAHAAELKPLLHTWSLGVEEQYYIVWPFILFLFARLGARFGKIFLWGVFLLSLGSSAVEVALSREAAFYLLPFRFWELMCGSLAALGLLPAIPAGRTANLLGLAGFGLVVASVFLFDSQTLFPGLSALLPCAGATLIIMASEQGPSLVARILSIRPVRFVGAISYSLYLWHWPVIVLPRHFLLRDATSAEAALEVAISFGLAIVSYYWVEAPFRSPAAIGRKGIYALGGGLIAAATLLAVVGFTSRGLPSRLPSDVVAAASAATDVNPRRAECDRHSPVDIRAGRQCGLGLPSSEVSFALFGDSFGDALMPGVDAAARQRGVAGRAILHSGCLPLPGVIQPDAACGSFAAAGLDYLRDHPEIRTIILIARWSAAVESSRLGAFSTTGYFLTDAESAAPGPLENPKVVERSLRRMIAQLPDRRWVIVSAIPEQLVEVPREVAIRLLRGLPAAQGVPRALFDERQRGVRAMVARIEADMPNVINLDLGAVLCGPDYCPVQKDGLPLYADDNHLDTREALSLAPVLARAFGQSG